MRDSNIYRERILLERSRARFLIAGVVLFCLANAAFALDPARRLSQYVHDKWGADRGFMGGEVYAIGQSADGYLWIGTDRGLVRFDGSSFTLIQRPLLDEAPIGPVRGLVSDADGDLWIRLEGPRLLLYCDGRFEDPSARFDLEDMTFTATAADNSGGVLLSALGGSTVRIRNGHLATMVRANASPGTVILLATTRDGETWLATQDNGLFRVSNGSATRAADGLQEKKVVSLLPASNGGLWIGTDHGMRFWDGAGLGPLDLPSSMQRLRILAMIQDHDANVWVGTNRGLIRVSPSRVASLDDLSPQPGRSVTALFEDRDGDIWFGGTQGIERLRDGMFNTYSTAEGLPSDSVGPVYAGSDGRIWFAPSAGGLYWMKDGKISRITAGGLDRDVVYSIAGGKGEICVGRQRGGLSVLTSNGNSFAVRTYTEKDGLAEDNVYSVRCGGEGAIWAGTVSAGVSRLNDGKFTNYSQATGLPSNSVNSIVESSDGNVWLATPNGLARWNRGLWKNYSARDGLPSSNAKTIFEDSQHVLWIATSGGLAYFEAGQVRVPRNLPELLREPVLGIAEDRLGSLWLTTPDHVLQVNRERLLSGGLTDTDVQSYGVADGLSGVEGVGRDPTVVSDSRGRIWISSNSGLSVADPIITANNAVPAMVRVESISADGKQVNLFSPIRLPSGTQSLILNFAGTNLAEPERTRFRYRLDGSDRGWSDIVASHQVVYSNMGPGPYRFRVVASNSDGMWNGPEDIVDFVIEPAFWQTWWFRIIGLSALLLAILVLYRLRMYQVTKLLNIRFQDRLAERTRIAQELHDTLLQGVLSASLQLDVAEEQLPEGSSAKPLVQRVLQLMKTVTEEGRNALRGLRAPEVDKTSLESAFARMRQEFVPDDRIEYRVIVDSTTRALRPMIRDEVYRIGREALVNAFVHAHARSIEVQVEYSGKHLRVLVRDDGRGIDQDVLHAGREGHWGLTGMRKRSESIGASLRLRSRVGAGTEVDLTVPGKIAFEDGTHRPLPQWLSRLGRGRIETRHKDTPWGGHP